MRVREAPTSGFSGAAWRISAGGESGAREAGRWTGSRAATPGSVTRAPQARAEPQAARADAASVLVVEDDGISRRILTQLLKASGYATDSAASGEDALRALESRPAPRVALVDLDLPGMDGMELIDRLGERDPATIPVLVTATDEESLAAAIRRRRVLYVRKPVDFNGLLRLLTDLQVPHADAGAHDSSEWDAGRGGTPGYLH
jgi:CheY-like chemotaxis protein